MSRDKDVLKRLDLLKAAGFEGSHVGVMGYLANGLVHGKKFCVPPAYSDTEPTEFNLFELDDAQLCSSDCCSALTFPNGVYVSDVLSRHSTPGTIMDSSLASAAAAAEGFTFDGFYQHCDAFFLCETFLTERHMLNDYPEFTVFFNRLLDEMIERDRLWVKHLAEGDKKELLTHISYTLLPELNISDSFKESAPGIAASMEVLRQEMIDAPGWALIEFDTYGTVEMYAPLICLVDAAYNPAYGTKRNCYAFSVPVMVADALASMCVLSHNIFTGDKLSDATFEIITTLYERWGHTENSELDKVVALALAV